MPVQLQAMMVLFTRYLLGNQICSTGTYASCGKRICQSWYYGKWILPGIVGTDMWVEIDKRFAEITGAAIGETYKNMWKALP